MEFPSVSISSNECNGQLFMPNILSNCAGKQRELSGGVSQLRSPAVIHAARRALLEIEKLKNSVRCRHLAVTRYSEESRLAMYFAMRRGISGGQESNGEGPWSCAGGSTNEGHFRGRKTLLGPFLVKADEGCGNP